MAFVALAAVGVDGSELARQGNGRSAFDSSACRWLGLRDSTSWPSSLPLQETYGKGSEWCAVRERAEKGLCTEPHLGARGDAWNSWGQGCVFAGWGWGWWGGGVVGGGA
jgi:hypothetical protein